MILHHQNMNINDLISKEWIITNGLGSYASSSIIGLNTRRYHGLLVNAYNPPTERKVILSSIDEKIMIGPDQAIDLSSNQYPGTIYPEGYKSFKFFERRPYPMFKYEAFDYHVLKSVFMVPGSNTTIVEYMNSGDTSYKLKLTPKWVYRDYHSLFSQNGYTDFYIERAENHFVIYPHYGTAPVYFCISDGEYKESREWYKSIEYIREIERGLDFREDVYSIFNIETVLAAGQSVYLMFSTENNMVYQNPEKIKQDILLNSHDYSSELLLDLVSTGNQFIVKRASTDSYSLIAGYHWFTDWGRDTMIAMRGLTIETGRQEISKSILKTFIQHLDQGMLPNRFPDHGESVEYNTIDATLWLFVTLHEYYQKFNDPEFIKECLPALKEIIQWHVQGTRYQIKVHEVLGFLGGGEPGVQLTWMDAKVNDVVITPRTGYPVEIQALWYNALNIYKLFCQIFEFNFDYQSILLNIETNFLRLYWNHDQGYLSDCLSYDLTPDLSFRPNQLYCASLPFKLMDASKTRRMFSTLRKKLWTPYGLRTLSTDHPDFKATYGGNPWQRDSAYHQGTVWPFLLSEYYKVFLNLEENSPEIIKQIENEILPMKEHFYKHDCILGISEIFDGEKPSAGKGTIHQAWSVGAMIQIVSWIEEIKEKTSEKSLKNFVNH